MGESEAKREATGLVDRFSKYVALAGSATALGTTLSWRPAVISYLFIAIAVICGADALLRWLRKESSRKRLSGAGAWLGRRSRRTIVVTVALVLLLGGAIVGGWVIRPVSYDLSVGDVGWVDRERMELLLVRFDEVLATYAATTVGTDQEIEPEEAKRRFDLDDARVVSYVRDAFAVSGAPDVSPFALVVSVTNESADRTARLDAAEFVIHSADFVRVCDAAGESLWPGDVVEYSIELDPRWSDFPHTIPDPVLFPAEIEPGESKTFVFYVKNVIEETEEGDVREDTSDLVLGLYDVEVRLRFDHRRQSLDVGRLLIAVPSVSHGLTMAGTGLRYAMLFKPEKACHLDNYRVIRAFLDAGESMERTDLVDDLAGRIEGIEEAHPTLHGG
jgi:hypothetical protein